MPTLPRFKHGTLGLYLRIALLIAAGIVLLCTCDLHAILDPIDLHVHTPADDAQHEHNQDAIDKKEYERACDRIDNGNGSSRDESNVQGWERDHGC